MSYGCNNGGCDLEAAGGCTRVPFFSHPGGTWGGDDPTGHGVGGGFGGTVVGETNNARKINEVAAQVAAFYDRTENSSNSVRYHYLCRVCLMPNEHGNRHCLR